MSDPAPQVPVGEARPGLITVERVSADSPDQYRFVATTSSGEELLWSEPFISLLYPPGNGRYEKRLVRNLIGELALMGWRAVAVGSPWYEHRLYLVGQGRVAPVPSKPRQGLSVQAMWGWTMAIVIVLFLLCVALVFTSELRISPA